MKEMTAQVSTGESNYAANLIRSIQGMRYYAGWTRDILMDIAAVTIERNLNDPIESLKELSVKQLQQVREAILGYKRISEILDNNGVNDEQAISRVVEILSDPGRSDMARKKKEEVAEELKPLSAAEGADVLTEALSKYTKIQRLTGETGKWPEDKLSHTGSIALDMATGIGGLPRGRIIEILGEESGGKSTLCLMTTAQAQAAGMVVLYIDAEQSYDPNWAKIQGVDTNEVLINQPNSLQSAIDVISKACEIQRDPRQPRLLIIVDSIAALPAQELLEGAAEKNQFIGLAARIWSTWLTKLYRMLNETDTTLLLVNQTREAIGMFVKKYDKMGNSTGGRAIKFAASMRIFVSADKRTDEGQIVNVNILKNKVGSPFKTASWYHHANQGIGPTSHLIETAVDYGVVAEDMQLDPMTGKELGTRKGWHSIALTDEVIEALKQYEAIDEDTGEIDADFDPENSEWNGIAAVSKGKESDFIDLVYDWPPLYDYIAELTYAQLGDADVENFDDVDGLREADLVEATLDENDEIEGD